jgi:cyanophycinase
MSAQYDAAMTGIIALQGGGPFRLHDELDRRLLDEVKATSVIVLPTADAFEQPEDLVESARAWAERLGVTVEPLMVMRRTEALETECASALHGARAIWLVGDNPIHLRSVLKDTPVWQAIVAVLESGGLVVGAGASASALCDPMIDPRGGALALGLGMVQGVSVSTESEKESPDRHARTKKLANVPLIFLPSSSAVVRRGSVWEHVGPSEIEGTLP